MNAIRLLITISFLTAIGAFAQTVTTPPSADKVMAEAKSKAAAANKNIFLHFSASWCGWCKKLDTFLAVPEIKPIIEKYFVPVELDVMENPDKKQLENPGADALMKQLDGEKSGLPFFAFLDAKGQMIVNSKPTGTVPGGSTIGYPVQPDEIAWFVSMLKKAVPAITKEEIKTIEDWLKIPAK